MDEIEIKKANIEALPVYTPYQNPYLREFVEKHLKEKPYIEEEDNYQKEPFAKDITEGKNDPIYNAHSYHTKVPPRAIEPYILHYTDEGDLILDPFCGSGMTGVAALKLNRKVILIDLSPSATFIAYNYTTSVKQVDFHNAVQKILNNLKEEMEWLYETRCRKCKEKAKIEYTIYSDVFRHSCGKEFPLWGVAVDKEKGKVLKNFKCPGCSSEVTKLRLKRIDTIPVRVNYTCPKCKRREDDISDFDLQKIKEIEEKWENKISKEVWYPRYRMPDGDESRRNDKIGITHTHHFYTTRNLWALARLWEEINSGISDEGLGVKEKLMFGFTGLLITVSKMLRLVPSKYFTKKGQFLGHLSGTLYIPAFSVEHSVNRSFLNRTRVTQKPLNINKNSVLISTQSASNIPLILTNSIDYIFTDPPFGNNLMYSELNFLWEAWLGYFTDNKEEAIINKTQKKGINEYKELMTKCFSEMFRVLKPGRFLTLVFHNSQKQVWDAIQDGLNYSGFDIISVNVLDKKQKSFKAVTSEGAVGFDVILNCRKPKKLEKTFEKNGISKENIDEILNSLKEYLNEVSLFDTEKRTPRYIYSKLVEKFSGTVPLDFDRVRKLLNLNFKNVDGAFYLYEQIPEAKAGLFDDNFSNKLQTELDVIYFLKNLLKEEKEWDEIYKEVYKKLDKKTIFSKDIRTILEENFILNEKTQKWRIPNLGEEDILKQQREKRLMKTFDTFLKDFLQTNSFKDLPDVSTIEIGFKLLYDKKDYKTIIKLGEKLPEESKSIVVKGIILTAKAKI